MASGRLRLHGEAAERGQHLHAVHLAVAVSVFLELGIAGPVPGVLNRPPVSHVLQEGFGCGPETRDVVMGLIDWLAIAVAIGFQRPPRGSRPIPQGFPLGARPTAELLPPPAVEEILDLLVSNPAPPP